MNKEKLMDYLYDEMSKTAKEEYHVELTKSGELEQLKSLESLRSMLSKSQDVDPGPPPALLAPQKKIHLSKWWAMAASLLVLLIAGKLLGIQMIVDNHQFSLSYGQTSAVDETEKVETNDFKYEEVLAALSAIK